MGTCTNVSGNGSLLGAEFSPSVTMAFGDRLLMMALIIPISSAQLSTTSPNKVEAKLTPLFSVEGMGTANDVHVAEVDD